MSEKLVPPLDAAVDQKLQAWREIATGHTIALGRDADEFTFQASKLMLGDVEFREAEVSTPTATNPRSKTFRGDDRFVFVQSIMGRRRHYLTGEVVEAEEGDFVFLRASAVQFSVREAMRSRAFYGPIEALGVDPYRLPDYVRFQAGTPVNRILNATMSSLATEAAETGGVADRALGEATLGLISGAVTGSRMPDAAQSRLRSARKQAVEAYIRDNLSNPELSVALVTATMGISRATLARDFEPNGGVARSIRRMRVERAMALITTGPPLRGKITAAAEAVGFFDRSHFNRAFREHFGLGPREAMQLFTDP
ncbi:MAG: AraC family transcriptional regulator [Pseudomonadota bacterium]